MTIGLDLDDTISNSSDIFVKYARVYNNKKGIKHSINQNELDVQKAFGWDSNNQEEFIRKNLKKILEDATPKMEAVEVINKLIEEGNKIVIITARRDNEVPNIKKLTERWLKKYKIRYDKLIVNCEFKEKECKKNNVDIFVDDNIECCKRVHDKLNIPSIIYTTRYNNKNNFDSAIRTSTWRELYPIINRIKLGIKEIKLDYLDFDNKEELPKEPEGMRYIYFYGGSKSYRAYIAPADMSRADFMKLYPEYIPEQNIPIYENNGIVVRADPKYPCPGFYIFALEKTYSAFDLLDDVTFLRFSFILKKIKEGMRSEIKINYAHLLSNEKSDPYVNVHFWLVPIDGETSPDLLDFDVKEYLESFNPKEQIDKIIAYNQKLREYIDRIDLVYLDNKLTEKLMSFK